MAVLPYTAEYADYVDAPPQRVFSHIDDPSRLASHMSSSSWRMGGGRMRFDFDDGRGQRVGSVMRLSGRILGASLSVTEAITEYLPPYRKVWETMDEPRLLVIGRYRLGVELSAEGAGSKLRVFLHYALPHGRFTRLAGRLLSRYYANWCTRQMVLDTAQRFAAQRATALQRTPYERPSHGQ
jgi:hypothetical protein